MPFVAQKHKRATVSATGCRFLEETKYLIFSFPRSGNEAKRIECRHSTRNASRIRRKEKNGS